MPASIRGTQTPSMHAALAPHSLLEVQGAVEEPPQEATRSREDAKRSWRIDKG